MGTLFCVPNCFGGSGSEECCRSEDAGFDGDAGMTSLESFREDAGFSLHHEPRVAIGPHVHPLDESLISAGVRLRVALRAPSLYIVVMEALTVVNKTASL